MIVSPNKKLKFNIKRLFFVLSLIIIVILTSSCTAYKMKSSSYRIIGEADLNADMNYNFNETLAVLHTDDTSLVVATIVENNQNECVFVVDEVIFGFLGYNEYRASIEASQSAQEEPLIIGQQYLLFVRGVGDNLSVSVDSNGWLKVDSGTVWSQDGKKISLERVKFEGEKVELEVFLPESFLFYRNLEDLVLNSDTIFVGSIQTIQEHDVSYFYSNDGFSRSASSPTEFVFAEVEEMIKGATNSQNVLIYDSEVMQKMVLDNMTREQKKINPESDLQRKYQNARYIFFLKNAPKNDAPYTFFVNAIQGMVPLDAENNTYLIYNNPEFTNSIYLDDLIYDITSLLDSAPSQEPTEITAD